MNRQEAQTALAWADFCDFWTELGYAVVVKAELDRAATAWNSIRKCFGAKGRPYGSKNKPKSVST